MDLLKLNSVFVSDNGHVCVLLVVQLCTIICVKSLVHNKGENN